jgi:hypothetical protein
MHCLMISIMSRSAFSALIVHTSLWFQRHSPIGVNDYRPISLLGGPIKLITKLLANRLQGVITQLVHENLYGFIK